MEYLYLQLLYTEDRGAAVRAQLLDMEVCVWNATFTRLDINDVIDGHTDSLGKYPALHSFYSCLNSG